MSNRIILAKKGIAELKKAEILVVRLLTYPRCQRDWDTLNEILFLIREVGARSKEVNG